MGDGRLLEISCCSLSGRGGWGVEERKQRGKGGQVSAVALKYERAAHTCIQFNSPASRVTRANDKFVQAFSFEELTSQYRRVPEGVSQLPFSLC